MFAGGLYKAVLHRSDRNARFPTHSLSSKKRVCIWRRFSTPNAVHKRRWHATCCSPARGSRRNRMTG